MSMPEPRPCNPCSCGCAGPSRRDVLKLAALSAAGLALGPTQAVAGPFDPADTADHFVPVDKKLKSEWVRLLFQRGQSQFYDGENLRMIGMPIGGITTGQVYLTGDGRLAHWDIFNQPNFSGSGERNYSTSPPASPIEQGFLMSIRDNDGQVLTRKLDRSGFPGVRFCGEYPLAWVEYADASWPVATTLEAFSPFCPLAEEDSSLPVTVMRFTLKNISQEPIDAILTGVLENAVCRVSERTYHGIRACTVVRQDDHTMVLASARPALPSVPPRKPIIVATFEGHSYGRWTAEGDAFGKGPARGTLDRQQDVSGFSGSGLVNSYRGGSDRLQGKLTSPPLLLERNYLCFKIGGGSHRGKTCVNLLVDGKCVHSMTGRNDEALEWRFWDVRPFAGKQARIEIVDAASGAWGHISVDQIELHDVLPAAYFGALQEQADSGTMVLAVLAASDAAAPSREAPFGQKLVGELSHTLRLAAGETRTVTFLVAWHFPNRPGRGNRYALRFKDASHVVRHVAANFSRLYTQTKLWHQTWYEGSTLPRWLLDRLFSTVSTLATGTCQWWANGRFWAWEGVGCCEGTCAHVWNYEHAMARLFPALERSVRVMQDLEPQAGFDPQTGAVFFRGEASRMWAADAQAGTALKCFREHQVTADGAFLRQYWPRIRRTIQFLIDQDADADGLIEGRQHNTYDVDFHGANTMVGSLYLGALRAGEQMAQEVGDSQFAATCRRVFLAGVASTLKRLWNGQYFIQQVDLAQHPRHQYANGCLSDHLFGQGWAWQVGLGRIYPKGKVLSALRAIWSYNWALDVGPQNQGHPPQRWFARPGEAGLFVCTWPKSRHPGTASVLYRDEIWTGVEYQVAGHMIWEGMLTEGLAICRGIHERYHPARHNPWNEVECGDHYARAMASYGVYLALCGFEYHGPNGHIAFAPRLTPEDFAAAFTAACGWGTFAQKVGPEEHRAQLALKWGTLRLRSFGLGLMPQSRPKRVKAVLNGQECPASLEVKDDQARIRFDKELLLQAGQTLDLALE